MSRQSLWVGTNIADRYCITGEIGGGGMGRVYSAIPFTDPSQTVAIKVIERTRLDHEDVFRFQREAALMSRLRHPNIIAFHELGLYQPTRSDGATVISGYYIVMEIAKGHDLKEALARGGRKSLDFFFEIGLQVSAALEYTHAKNIIHRDIKPQNIIIERAVESEHAVIVKVLDFGIARLTELDLYGDDDSNLQDVAGTPLYMAPENSKYLDAPNDHRADLYSLGCMLYEVLAGRPPFLGNTREKLARDHAQALPEPLTQIRPDIPQVVNDLVMKLIAKHPKDRYQTAFGLHVDLQRMRKQLRVAGSRLLPFSLGRYDRLNILPSSIAMVGRESEFESLVANYNAIAKENSRSRLAVIHGGPGSGKTRLLKEFRAYLAQHRIRYISTSFSRHENNLPFNALANGFNEYLVHVFKTQPLEAEEIKRKVRTLLGPTASLVAQIVQGLKPYLDEELEDEKVRSDLEQEKEFDFNDFAKAFSDFTRCLASDAEPVAFFFDDMQWADPKSLELIDRFFSHNNSQRFFLLISYQTLVEGVDEELKVFIQKFSKLRRRFHEIELGFLDRQAIGRLNSSILAIEHELDKELVDYLAEKTHGNPLYLLEMHRSLVTQELLRLDDRGVWTFEMQEVLRSHISSNSIDLIYNRLNELPHAERQVLEIAAVLGSHFELALLKAVRGLDTTLVQRAIQYGTIGGLIIRSAGGGSDGAAQKSYSFTHRSIREALIDGLSVERRCELHYRVAETIEIHTSNHQAQAIFTLAHHFFQALRDHVEAQREVIQKALLYNIRAGSKALEVQSQLTAQRYYENARQLLPYLKDDQKNLLQHQKQILHALADIHLSHRNYAESMRIYKDMRELPLNQGEYAFVVYKLLVLSLVSGHVAATLRELFKAFQELHFPVIRIGFWSNVRTTLTLIRCIAVPLHWSLPVRILRKAERVQLKRGRLSFHPLLLYLVGQNTALNFDKRLGVVYHVAFLRQAKNLSLPEDLALRMLCDHALILAYLGLSFRAYKILELVQQIARDREWVLIQAYATFTQTLIVDPFGGKQEDVWYSLERMQADLNVQEFRLAAMQESIFRVFVYFTQGQGKELTRLIHNLPSLLTIRHWLTSRAIAMYLFWLMLVDSRDLIVSYRSFIAKRAQQSKRRQDIFLWVIEAIVALAAGERDRAKSAYFEVLKDINDRDRDPMLMPHEFDLLLLFIGFYAEVYAFEYGDELWLNNYSSPLLQKIMRFTRHHRHVRRPIPVLVRARIADFFHLKETKKIYDLALKKSRLTQQSMIEMIGEMWFGRHLLQERGVMRIDYLSKANESSRKHGLHLLFAMSRKMAQDLGQLSSEDLSGQHAAHALAPIEVLDLLLQRHIEMIPQLRPENLDLEAAKLKVFELLRDRLTFDQVHLITLNDIIAFEAIGRPPADKSQQMIAYVSPYLNLRSSLTIPIGDAPWVQGDSTLQHTRSSINLTPGAISSAEDVESTLVLSQVEEPSPTGPKESSFAYDFDRTRHRSMNTLVPIRYGPMGLGILFLEKSRLQDEDSTVLRQLLDTLGAQMGIWLRAYLPIEPRSAALPLLHFNPGSFHLEPCSWLHVWTEGHLRSTRESVWYLGVNLSEQAYLLTYCRINGPEEHRAPLSAALWHEIMALRTLFSGTGRDQMNPDDVQEAIERHLHVHAGIQSLESLVIAFSIIHKQTGEVASGHFGAARPFTLGVPNEVTPLNRVVLQLSNGRYLRYWKVMASELQRGILILAHDSSKLDRLNLASLIQQGLESMTWEQKRVAFLAYLKQNLIEGHIPRYFVAAAWNGAGQTAAPTLERAG